MIVRTSAEPNRVQGEQADAAALIRDHGAEAYGEARQRERDVALDCRSSIRRAL